MMHALLLITLLLYFDNYSIEAGIPDENGQVIVLSLPVLQYNLSNFHIFAFQQEVYKVCRG